MKPLEFRTNKKEGKTEGRKVGNEQRSSLNLIKTFKWGGGGEQVASDWMWPTYVCYNSFYKSVMQDFKMSFNSELIELYMCRRWALAPARSVKGNVSLSAYILVYSQIYISGHFFCFLYTRKKISFPICFHILFRIQKGELASENSLGNKIKSCAVEGKSLF